jgi:hypothetical protein
MYMVKITIYVPDELKSRMDGAEGVNWSPLACSAFEQKLAEIISRKEAKNMKEVVARLKASNTKARNSVGKLAFMEGENWAKKTAESDELKRLDTFVRNGMRAQLLGDNNSAWATGEQLYFAIRPDHDGDRDSSREFWDQFSGLDWDGDTDETEDALNGFTDRALSDWDAVNDQL